MYANIDASGPTPTVTFMFLFQELVSTPIETIGGSIQFGFTDANGDPLPANPSAPSTVEAEWIPLNITYDNTGTYSLGDLPAGTYVWQPTASYMSLTVGSTVYNALVRPVGRSHRLRSQLLHCLAPLLRDCRCGIMGRHRCH